MSETIDKIKKECCDATDKNFTAINKKCSCEYSYKGEYTRFFAKNNTFIDEIILNKIKFYIKQLETVFLNDKFKEKVNLPPRSIINGGVFMSYDFHIIESQPKLIEVNVNAGGIFLAHQLAKQSGCCCSNTHPTNLNGFKNKIIEMFNNEYRLKSNNRKLQSVAIVDTHPENQFLYPDFLLCQALLVKNGIKTFIVDPSELNYSDGKVWVGDNEIDLIYNRLTDFYFEELQHQMLKQIYIDKAAVISPSPADHQIFANKSSLILLNDTAFMTSIINPRDYQYLKPCLLSTQLLSSLESDVSWESRKNFFFKPVGSFGSKGAYNGDGVTKKVWQEMQSNDYVAQEFAPAGKRISDDKEYKYDLRVYTYQGDILLVTARLFKGQTTNFRTEGGGFSAVLMV